MFRTAVAAVIFGAATPSSEAADQQPGASVIRLPAVLEAYQGWLTEADPIAAGLRGDSAAAQRWPDVSPAAVAIRTTRLRAIQALLARIAPGGLAGEDALNRAVLAWRIDTDLRGAAFDEERIPFTSDEGFFLLPAETAGSLVLRTPGQADAWLARLRALPAWYGQQIDNMRRGLRTGFTQPRLTVEAVLRTLRKATAVQPEADPLLAPIDALPAAMPQEMRTALHAQAIAILRTLVKPARQRLVDFFAGEYVAGARTSIGAADLPNGRAYYRYLVARETSTDLSPDAIYAMGQSEVARIRTAMQAQMQHTGFSGSLQAFQAMLRHDPRFIATSPRALLERASFLAKRVDDRLPRFFGRLPRLTYGVRPVPDGIADGYTSARYFPGSPDQGVAGGLMINTAHLDQRPLYELPALVAHEGAPGHHIQIALAQELTGLPTFRRDLQVTAFVEGWALYAEQLAGEMGLYETPYDRFGLLSMEMWRACRLVVDVGIHWRGWTRDQALACLRDNTALAERNIQTEVDRYIAWPGQALGYKVGELHILGLRRRAEAALGRGFDERAFHDTLLDEGALPLAILDTSVEAWITHSLGR